MDISDIRKLVQVEEMEVVRMKPPPRKAAHADESERWEDKWNGRKNFKRFRRRGEGGVVGGGRRLIDKVIVPLEEVRKRDYGIGDEYWEDSGDSQRRSKKKGKEKEKEKETQTRDISHMDTMQSSTSTRGNKQSSSSTSKSATAVERASRILAEEVEDGFEVEEELENHSEVEIVSQPPPPSHKHSLPHPTPSSRSSRSQGGLTDRTNQSPSQSQSLRVPETVISSTAGSTMRGESRKRVASSAAGDNGRAKKVKQSLIRREESEDDSDDDLKFKRKKRG